MLSNQIKALFIILTNQNKVLRIKIKQSSENSLWKRILGTAVRLSIFSNAQLINKKIGSNIDGHMK